MWKKEVCKICEGTGEVTPLVVCVSCFGNGFINWRERPYPNSKVKDYSNKPSGRVAQDHGYYTN